jgi:hypothetical protein
LGRSTGQQEDWEEEVSEKVYLRRHSPNLGSDPEIFVRDSKGHLVDSHTALREVPFEAPKFPHLGKNEYYGGLPKGSIVTDGTQAEIHPQPYTCLGYLCNSTFGLLRGWDIQLQAKGYRLDFTQNIELTEEDLERFDPSCRQLGCQPSLNVYDPDSTLGIDPTTYKWRSAGGHIHIGHNLSPDWPLVKRLGDIVPLLDVLVGNTFVLIDRDPLASQRRKVYGRAGEYRLPSYGLEYRTLSNVWLRAFPLHSLAFELARLAFNVAYTSSDRLRIVDYDANNLPKYQIAKPLRNFAGELMSAVKIQDIIEAINGNDFDLAAKNFNKIRGWISEVCSGEDAETTSTGVAYPLTANKLVDFDFFVQKGYQAFFGHDPSKWIEDNWHIGSFRAGNGPIERAPYLQASNGYTDPGHSRTWNNFLLEVIRPMREAEEKAAKLAQMCHMGLVIQDQQEQASAQV